MAKASKAKDKAAQEVEPAVVAIEVPVSREKSTANFPLHIDLRLNREQANALRRMAAQLDEQKAVTASGKRVVDNHGAIRWLLEEIAAKSAG